MAGGTVKRWVISEDGCQLIKREDVKIKFLEDVGGKSQRVIVKDDQPVTSPLLSVSSSSSPLSIKKRSAVPSELPVSYPCSYCDICFTASHYLEKHLKRSHRKQNLEILPRRDISFNKQKSSLSIHLSPSSSLATPVSSPSHVFIPSLVRSETTCQSPAIVGPDCYVGRGPINFSLKTAVVHNNHHPAPSTSNSKSSAPIPSPRYTQKDVQQILKRDTTEGLPQTLSLSSEKQLGNIEIKRDNSCDHCGRRREGQSERDGVNECCCQEGTHFLCNECGQSFPSFPSLGSHQDCSHKGNVVGKGEEARGETLYLCAECGRSFPCLDLLHEHQSLHNSLGVEDGEEETEKGKGDDNSSFPFTSQAHSCPNCHKIFKTARYLKTHMKIHSGQVPYHCDRCDKPFTQLGDLKTHHRTHTGERPYQCSLCGKCFGRSGTLKKHWRTHTGETPYVCTVCGKQFNQLGALKTHERIHSGLRPYSCARCSQHFTYSYQLKRHRCTHSDQS